MSANFTDLIDYFKLLASQHLDIRHSPAEPHFYRFEIEEVLTNLKKVNYPALILEGYRYSLHDNKGDGLWKERSGAFVLLDHLSDTGDYNSMHQLWNNLETICDELIARIKQDKRNPSVKVVRDIDLSSFEVSLIANELDRNYGIRCTFTISSPVSLAIDPTKWDLTVNANGN